MMIAITVRGRAALARQLGQCAAAAEQTVQFCLHELAEEIAADARARVRRQRDADRPLPSRLAGSIGVEREADAVFVRACAPYAVYVELGTARMEAEPFLQPAFDAAVADITARPDAVVLRRSRP